jgi:alkylated DNA repair protein (DNA oxidative demethylase)
MQHRTGELFDTSVPRSSEQLIAGAWVLRGFALDCAAELYSDIRRVSGKAPFRHLMTPGGLQMSVAMTNCGRLGWVSDRRGYRYETHDPLSGHPWPPMPSSFFALAQMAAHAAGFSDFAPDACLVNRYQPGARLSLHQDKDERDFDAPIVSVSLGLSANFLFGGLARRDKQRRLPLAHGDVLVWGGPARLNHHGVLPLKDGEHPMLGRQRLNLTFRFAG